MVIQDKITLGELVAFFSLIWYIIGPMWGLGFHINNFTQSKASGEKILEILHQYVHVKDQPDSVELSVSNVKGHVTFDHVSFAYPDKQPSLFDFAVDAPAGSVIGLLGGTGRVLIDGQDIREVTIQSLRSQIGVVLLDTFIFSGTIRDNIRFGRLNATDEEVELAAKAVHALDFILNLHNGFDTEVQERGNMLSMGQRQLILFARALLADPRILILDEATASIDTETELKIQEAL